MKNMNIVLDTGIWSIAPCSTGYLNIFLMISHFMSYRTGKLKQIDRKRDRQVDEQTDILRLRQYPSGIQNQREIKRVSTVPSGCLHPQRNHI